MKKYDVAYDEMSKIYMQISGHESIMYRMESNGDDAGVKLQQSIINGLKKQLEELKHRA